MTTPERDAPLKHRPPCLPDPAPLSSRPSLAAWIALGLAADASLLLALYLAVNAGIPDTDWLQLVASVSAFAAVPWFVHRTALPWLFVAVPTTLWGKVSALVYVVPYAAVSAVAAPIAVLQALYLLVGITAPLGEAFEGRGIFPSSPIAHTATLGLFAMWVGAASGAIYGGLLHLGQALRYRPTPPLIRLRSDMLGGAIAGAIGSLVLVLTQGGAYYSVSPSGKSDPALATTPFEVAVLLVVTGTFALLPHLILTGLDARAHPISPPPASPAPPTFPTSAST